MKDLTVNVSDDAAKLSAVSGELLEWLKTTAQNSESFVLEQAPLYVQEYLAWYRIEAVIGLVICGGIAVALAVACVVVCRKLLKAGELEGAAIAGFVGAVFLAIVLIPAGVSLTQMVKAIAAPRVVIVEHVGDVLGRKN